MATETHVRLRSTSIEGLVMIPIGGATTTPPTIESACPLPAPDMEWYGDGGGSRPFYGGFYYPVLDAGSPSTTSPAFRNGYDLDLPWNIEANCKNDAGGQWVREEWFYFECTEGWETYGVKITLDAGSDIGAGFEIRESTAPTTRRADGYLYDYAGAPNLLLEPFLGGMETVYLPTRTGAILADDASLALGGSVFIPGPMAGRALVFRPKNQIPTEIAGVVFSDFVLDLGNPV